MGKEFNNIQQDPKDLLNPKMVYPCWGPPPSLKEWIGIILCVIVGMAILTKVVIPLLLDKDLTSDVQELETKCN